MVAPLSNYERVVYVKIEYRDNIYEVIAWHKDTTRTENYVLTLLNKFGRRIEGIEKKLTDEEIKQLQYISKDDTGL